MVNVERFSALYHRDFRLFWFGQLISLSGTWMHSVAQGWLVYSLTKSPFYLGIVATASTLPILLFTLIGGIVADRFRKRDLIILTQVLSIAPPLMLGILTDLNVITVYQVILLAIFLGTVNAFDMPARQSFVIEMVGKEHLLNAIALNSAAFNGARMIGPVVAGFVIAYLGLPACFYLNAVSFIAVIIALSRIKVKGESKVASKGFFRELPEGIQFIKKQRDILYAIVLIAIFSLFGIPYMSFLPVFAEEVFGAGAKGLGFLVSATGIGAFSAAIIIALKGNIENKWRYMSAAGLCFSLSLFAVSISKVFWVSLILLAFAGWGIVSFLATANSFIQLSTTDNLRGRVMSVYTLVFLGFVPIGSSIIGITADSIGTINAVAISSVICLIGAIMFSIKHLKKD
jgi:MFS family permease